ncbi:LPS export ABC transporter permease LptG [Marinomonas mediterranea]|jgi:Predicted permeases|uniref:Permease YjgP/YjgQ family protein n=1 Tax=Marinomonas mediterranea (strain ATCC 700492 / JCM 21426 / NBRC 103028 / MMB-1) TaxID=717774 RepID=F2JV56_MARM1|nr:LPS export ABC transporter permease LptG [Marinomonas mediterranea]ADZ92814.1 permease YjgP/YjgQ family protein [Marinomonas mediterranea MMB-1]WCN10747.1 LPS export ABC transporter permease LptG [Marinomonas mediterranea]WCN14804.1 LPS export ABC transporter permease LptG [Marinomonas mediterranea]WCN18837.1 LPS export ABC transporter permease LptG [Marinomonas mediterranea MMB-1]
MSRFDRYIGSSVLWSFAAVIFVLLGLDFALTFIDQVKKVNDSYTTNALLQVLAYRAPIKFAEYIPVASLIGTLIGLGALASTSELTVIRATGVPIWRIGFAACKPILLISLIGVGISEYVSPYATQQADLIERLRGQSEGRFALTGGVWIKSDGNFVYINAADREGVLYDIQIFTPNGQALEKIQKAKFARHLSDNQWRLEQVTETHFLGDRIETGYKETVPWTASLKPSHLFLASQEPEALSLSELHQYQSYLTGQELNAGLYQLEFWTKSLMPFACFALVIVALSSVFGPLRSSTMGGRIFSGVLIGIMFQNGLNLFGKMSLALSFSPLIGVAIPIALCFAIGLLLMSRKG